MSKSFEDLRVFQRALDLMADVYQATESFPKSEMYGLTSQLRRAAGSVVSHIAEGEGRITYGEWRQMLSEARGSIYEVQAHLMGATRVGFMPKPISDQLRASAALVGRMLAGLIRYVRRLESTAKLSRKRAANGQQRA
jgi:four helix bundle protein